MLSNIDRSPAELGSVFRVLVIASFSAISTVAHALGWTPAGPADGGTQPAYGYVATHPLVGGQAMIAAGFVPGKAQFATMFTSDGGQHWTSNARAGGFGVPKLAGTPTVAFLADGGQFRRSPDQGRTWAPVPLPALPPNSSFELGSVNPANPGEILGSAGATIWRTVDGGVSWSSDPAPAPVSAMAVDWSTRRLYASFTPNSSLGHRPIDTPGAWGVGGTGPVAFAAGHGVVLYRNAVGAMFRSTDGGSVFAPVAEPIAPTPVCEFAFAASPSRRIYALECETNRILRSSDDGATWQVQATLVEGRLGSLAVDASDPNRLYVVTSNGTLLSEDGGATYRPLNRSTGAPGTALSLFFDATNADRQWVSRASSLPAWLQRSIDGGATWSGVDFEHRLIGASRSRANTLFGTLSTSTDRGLLLSTDGGETWTEKVAIFGSQGASVGPLAFGQALGEIYVAAFTASLGNNVSMRLFSSNDDGDSFTERFAPPVRVYALAAAPTGPATLYAGGPPQAQGTPQLYRSTNGAVTWQPVATFPASLSSFADGWGNTVTALAIDPSDPNRIYAGFFYPDYVMRSDDGGATWSRATSGLGAGEITSLAIDPANPSTIYASQLGSGVFRSVDRGATWTALDEGIHDDVVLGVALDPHAAGRVYAETGSGLYRADLASGVPAGDRRAIEFYHRAMNHYFVSADLDEIAGLDAGVFQGWSRTGEGFRVAEATSPGNAPTCRFFTVSGSMSTHFYTPYANECDLLKADPAWIYEKIAFGLAVPGPDPSAGCPPGTRALRRFFNAMENGVPNHRYSTSQFTYEAMIDKGWVFEGIGSTLVFACVPY